MNGNFVNFTEKVNSSSKSYFHKKSWIFDKINMIFMKIMKITKTINAKPSIYLMEY